MQNLFIYLFAKSCFLNCIKLSVFSYFFHLHPLAPKVERLDDNSCEVTWEALSPMKGDPVIYTLQCMMGNSEFKQVRVLVRVKAQFSLFKSVPVALSWPVIYHSGLFMQIWIQMDSDLCFHRGIVAFSFKWLLNAKVIDRWGVPGVSPPPAHSFLIMPCSHGNIE